MKYVIKYEDKTKDGYDNKVCVDISSECEITIIDQKNLLEAMKVISDIMKPYIEEARKAEVQSE